MMGGLKSGRKPGLGRSCIWKFDGSSKHLGVLQIIQDGGPNKVHAHK